MTDTSDGIGREAGDGGGTGYGARRPKLRLPRLGILGWLIAIVAGAIAIGIAVLAWLAWDFQVESARKAAADAGEVPVMTDFAPGQPKPDDVLFRVAGSAALADQVIPDIAAAWMRGQGYGGVSIDRAGQVIEVEGSRGGQRARVLVVSGTATGAFRAMVERRVEAVVSMRPIAPAEADRLSAFGDMNNPASERVVGLVPELIVVHRSNPVDAITTDTLARVVAGEITDWADIVSQKSGPIEVRLEDPRQDGTAVSGLLGDREAPETAERLPSATAVFDEVAAGVARVGIAIRNSDAAGVKALGVGERNARIVMPDDFSVLTEAYPFTRRARLYVGSSNVDTNARSFADFVATQTGRTIARRSGFLAPAMEAVSYRPTNDAPQGYRNFAAGAQRMNFDLRFHLGSSEPDAKAARDIDEFVQFAKANNIDPRRIALLGFADNVGARATNVGLAQARAETVANTLRQKGLGTGLIRSFGEAMPVGANATEEGRIRNRRVEVWICAPPACPLIDLAAGPLQDTTPQARTLPAGVRLGPGPRLQPGDEPPKG